MASSSSAKLPLALAQAYFGSGTFKILLVSAVPTETQLDTWNFRSAVTNEITGTGYTAGGVAVVPTVGAYDAGLNAVPVTWANLSNAWTNATFSAVGAWIYKNIGTAATDELVEFVDFNGTVTATNGPFSITFSAPHYVYR